MCVHLQPLITFDCPIHWLKYQKFTHFSIIIYTLLGKYPFLLQTSPYVSPHSLASRRCEELIVDLLLRTIPAIEVDSEFTHLKSIGEKFYEFPKLKVIFCQGCFAWTKVAKTFQNFPL